jgi:hypothetical protein
MFRFTNIDHKPTKSTPIYEFLTHPLLPLRQALDPLLSQIGRLDEFIMIAQAACHYPSEHGLDREESASIFLYTMDWGEQSLYRVLNAALRIPNRLVLVPWHGYLKLFYTALEKLPGRHIVLWRGVTDDVKKNFKEDEKLTWWGFSSCSTSLSVIQNFLGPTSTLFLINAENGKDISAYSNFPKEKEVILGLGTRLRVVSDGVNLPSLNIVHLAELLDENQDELLFVPKTIDPNQRTIDTRSK